MKLTITENVQNAIEIHSNPTYLEIVDFDVGQSRVPLSLFEDKGDVLVGLGASSAAKLAIGDEGEIPVVRSGTLAYEDSRGNPTVELCCFDYSQDVIVTDNAGFLHIPPHVNGMNLVYVHAETLTAGVTGNTSVQIVNTTHAVNMLSTELTVGSTKTGSDESAVPAVIDLNNDYVVTNDMLNVRVTGVSTTAPKGLIVTLGFQAP